MYNHSEYKDKAVASASSGCSVSAVVQIVFIILKLCKVITWSW